MAPLLLGVGVEDLHKGLDAFDGDQGEVVVVVDNTPRHALQRVEMLQSGLPPHIVRDEFLSDHHCPRIILPAQLDHRVVHPVIHGVDGLGRHYGLFLLLVTFHQNEEDFEECVVAIVGDFISNPQQDLGHKLLY